MSPVDDLPPPDPRVEYRQRAEAAETWRVRLDAQEGTLAFARLVGFLAIRKYLGTNPEDVAKLARDLRHLLHPQTTTSVPGSVEIPADAWYMRLPAVNAALNGLAGVLLAAGFLLIKQRRITAHRNVMLTAFAVSIVFLACYLVYHEALRRDTGLPGKPFPGTGASLIFYRTILVTHVILAAAVPFLASVTIYRGLKADWARHRKIAKITFPIWMYVSVTGVIIYLMLYHWPIA